MKQVLWWLRCQRIPNVYAALGPTRCFEHLETRFCFSADGVPTSFQIDPVVESAEIFMLDRASSSVETTSSEPIDSAGQASQVEPPTSGQGSVEDAFEYYHPEWGTDPDSCTEDDLEGNLNREHVCEGVWVLPSNVETLAGASLAEVSRSQDDHEDEPSQTPLVGAPVTNASSESIQFGPQLQPIDQLSINPIAISNLPSQPVVVSHTMDSHGSYPVGDYSEKVGSSQRLTPSNRETLVQSPRISVQASLSVKSGNPVKPTLSQSTVNLRPQLSQIPSIMPQHTMLEDRSVEVETGPQIVLKQLQGAAVDTVVGKRLVAVNQTGKSDELVSHSPVVVELKDEIVSRKQLLVGAILAGWIAAPRRAKGRLVGNIQARTGWVYGLFFRRDKSRSNRPIVLEEADK